jgi:mannose-6-phosphate isomerase-like protein (cupin superfamily)
VLSKQKDCQHLIITTLEKLMIVPSFRRVVTGHNASGKAVIIEDGPPTRVAHIGNETGPVFYEVWNTSETPARIDRASLEPPEDGIKLAPPSNGTRIRVLDFPPESNTLHEMSPEDARALFAEVGAEYASSHDGVTSRHAHMHRTQTIDYGIILEGEITLIMDEGETTVKTGDIIIQRGTNHGWANRSGKNCRIAFILIDGKFDNDIA